MRTQAGSQNRSGMNHNNTRQTARLQNRTTGRKGKYEEEKNNANYPVGDAVRNHERFGTGKAVKAEGQQSVEDERDEWDEEEEVTTRTKDKSEQDVRGEMKVRGGAGNSPTWRTKGEEGYAARENEKRSTQFSSGTQTKKNERGRTEFDEDESIRSEEKRRGREEED